MKLTDLGERKVIERLKGFLDIGDDAAVIRQRDEYLVLTTDMLYAPKHILDEMMWNQIGKYVVTVNFSDIAAMSAKPIGFLLAYGSGDIGYEDFEALIRAADKQCKRYGSKFLGGDLNEIDELTMGGFAIGTTDRPVFRHGAKPNQLVCVTGVVGDAALGAYVLVNDFVDRCDKKSLDRILVSTLEPEPRVKEGYLLRDYATSMTDISDSLAISLYGISEQSSVGMEINSEKLPLSKEARNVSGDIESDVIEHALYGGGDYELVFTTQMRNWPWMKDRVDATVIGKTNDTRQVTLDGKGIKKQGFEHF